MRQCASERFTLQHSQIIFSVVIGCFLTLLSRFKVKRVVKNDAVSFVEKVINFNMTTVLMRTLVTKNEQL